MLGRHQGIRSTIWPLDSFTCEHSKRVSIPWTAGRRTATETEMQQESLQHYLLIRQVMPVATWSFRNVLAPYEVQLIHLLGYVIIQCHHVPSNLLLEPRHRLTSILHKITGSSFSAQLLERKENGWVGAAVASSVSHRRRAGWRWPEFGWWRPVRVFMRRRRSSGGKTTAATTDGTVAAQLHDARRALLSLRWAAIGANRLIKIVNGGQRR